MQKKEKNRWRPFFKKPRRRINRVRFDDVNATKYNNII